VRDREKIKLIFKSLKFFRGEKTVEMLERSKFDLKTFDKNWLKTSLMNSATSVYIFTFRNVEKSVVDSRENFRLFPDRCICLQDLFLYSCICFLDLSVYLTF
jgi:hypothetical protein